MNAIVSEFDITADDFREAQTEHLYYGSTQATRVRWFSIAGIGFIVLGSGLIFSGRPYGGALVMLGMMFLILQRLRIASSVRAFSREEDKYRGIKTEISEDGVRIVTAMGARMWKWNEVFQVLESPKQFLLYLDEKSFSALPKRAMLAEQIEQAKTMMKAHVSRYVDRVG
jgi:hypothetical protein